MSGSKAEQDSGAADQIKAILDRMTPEAAAEWCDEYNRRFACDGEVWFDRDGRFIDADEGVVHPSFGIVANKG